MARMKGEDIEDGSEADNKSILDILSFHPRYPLQLSFITLYRQFQNTPPRLAATLPLVYNVVP
jgi:hypothetical protein